MRTLTPTQPRMVGMNRNQKPQPLLSRINGKKRTDLSAKVPDEAPPIGSSDDENETSPASRGTSAPGKSLIKPVADSSESDSDASRGAIQSTRFGASKPNTSGKKETKNAGTRTRTRTQTSIDDSQSMPSVSKRRKLDSPEPVSKSFESVSSSAEHLKNELGFVRTKQAKSTYGAKKYGSSQESRPKKAKHEKPSKKAKLKDAPASDAFDSPSKSDSTSFRAPAEADLSSPSKGGSKFVRHSQDKDDDSEDDQVSSLPKRPIPKKATLKTRHRGNIWKSQKPSKAPRSPKLTFMVPAEISSFSQESLENGDDRPGSPLSALSDLSGISDSEQDVSAPGTDASQADQVDSVTTTTTCPWCGDEVPEALLKEFSKGKRLNVRMQTLFCQKHKKQTAMDSWKERKYPSEICWPDLASRFSSHRPHLLKVVSGEPSHFRSILAKKIETGKARNLKKEDNLNPGYYGPRGFNIMCDYLVNEFRDMLKQKAVSDRVIAGRGSAAFIESVLVAELAVCLIQEDMDVSVEEARDILEESKAIGDIVNEDV